MPFVGELRSTPSPDFVLKNDEKRTPQFAQTLAEYHRYLKNYSGPDNKVFKARIKGFGEKFHNIGGHPGMQLAHYFIQAMWAQGEYGEATEDQLAHPRYLELLWDGIGVWKG